MPTPDPCIELKRKFSFFPCLHPIEKTVYTALVAIRVGLMLDIVLKSQFDEAWSLTGDPVGGPRYNNFVFVYYLLLTTIDIDGEEIEVYILQDPYWFEVLLAAGGCDAFNLDAPCKILDYSRQ